MFAARNMMFARSSAGYDADAADYFDRIIAAESSITTDNKTAVNNFIVGCKADGIWDAIKASCLLAGPDTLAGALVPLVGVAPTNNFFGEDDYSRTTGLKGDGSTKRLDSNRIDNADPQDNSHIAAWVSQLRVGGGIGIMGSIISGAGIHRCVWEGYSKHNSATLYTESETLGLRAVSRATAASYTYRGGGVSRVVSESSTGTSTGMIGIFSRLGGTYFNGTNSRLSFYSIGESLDLALLDARLTTYMASLT